jgi:hypothetical protein
MDTEQVLDAIDTALNVIKTVANTPGVNVLPYAALVSSAVSAIQLGIGAGRNVLPYVEALKNTFSGGVPTQADMDALDAKIKELEAQVQAAPPPADEGEPD